MALRSLRLPAWVDEIDDQVDHAWDILRGNTALDRLFYTASTVGDFSAIWHGYNVIRLVSTADGKRRFGRLAIALAVESLVVNQGLKRLFDRERPQQANDHPHHLRTPLTSSFPSGHASSATMAAKLVSERTKAGPAATVIAAVVATSRIHVRIHHASDVVVGAAVGAGIASIWKRVWPLG